MIGRIRITLPCLLILLFSGAYSARAEPYLAVQLGLKCGQCHVNPTGGGLRTAFCDVFAQTVLAAQHLGTGLDKWTRQLGPYLRAGGDFRFDGTVTQGPHTKTAQEFGLEQTCAYMEAS